MQQIIDLIEDVPGAAFVKPSPNGQIWGFNDPQTAIDFAFAHRDTVVPVNWSWYGNQVPEGNPGLGDAQFAETLTQFTIRIVR